MVVELFIGFIIGVFVTGISAYRVHNEACKCLEGIRQDENAVSKTVECKSFAGSSPAPSVTNIEEISNRLKEPIVDEPISKKVEKMSEPTPKEFEIYRDAAREFRWRLKANNGKIIATSNDGYHNKADAEHSIMLVKNASSETTIQDLT